jgi:hypothetical protein
MNKYPLIGGSICAVVLLVLTSLINVVGYQTVQSSDQKIILAGVNQKELLFQTILDMANNMEIQKVILASEITGKGFFTLDMRFSVFTPSVLTEKFLKRMYTIGVIFSKTINKSKIHSILKQNQMSNQAVQKEISAIIEKDATLKGEMTQLSSVSCDCGNKNTTSWSFPVLCALLSPIVSFCEFVIVVFYIFFYDYPHYINNFYMILLNIGLKLNCIWY